MEKEPSKTRAREKMVDHPEDDQAGQRFRVNNSRMLRWCLWVLLSLSICFLFQGFEMGAVTLNFILDSHGQRRGEKTKDLNCVPFKCFSKAQSMMWVCISLARALSRDHTWLHGNLASRGSG